MTMKSLTRLFTSVALAAPLFLGLGWSSPAQAQVYSFGCITANDTTGTDCDIAESQLTLTLSGDANQVIFRFDNIGSSASSITDVYFGSALNLSRTGASIVNGAGVSFSFDASPGSLPGGGAYSFSTSVDADSNRPTASNGVNPGETLSFTFLSNYSTVLGLMNTYAPNSVVGIHVQAFANGQSESLVTTVTAVPEPGTYALMLAGLAAVGFMARRRRQA